MTAFALAVVLIAPACSSGSSAAQHSVPAVRGCLQHHGVAAAIVSEPPGDYNLFDIRGTIVANLGAATVTIDVSGDESNIAEYSPNGTAAPKRLVEAVWDCAGRGVTTTPDTCNDDGCVSAY